MNLNEMNNISSETYCNKGNTCLQKGSFTKQHVFPKHKTNRSHTYFAMKLSQTAIDALAGSTSGLVVSVVMSPLDVMKTRLQVSRQPKDRISRGVFMIMKELYLEDGIKSFYKGLGTTMLGYIPNWSIYFVTYQYSRSTLYNSIQCK